MKGADPGLVVTTPTDTQIVLTRRFAAPRRLVFAALTEPDLLRRWLGAEGWHLVEAVLVEDEAGNGAENATVLTTTLTYPSREVRDHVARTPMERGVGEGYRRLAGVLAEIATRDPHPGGTT